MSMFPSPLILVAAVVTLAACAAHETTPPRTPAPAPAPAAADMADELCACADEDCARPLMTKLFGRQLESTDSTHAYDAEYDRAVACYRARWDNANARLMMAAVPGIVDETCACAEAACVKSAEDRLGKWFETVGASAVLDRLQVAQLSENMTRFAGCAGRLAPPSPIVELALRTANEICACADLECAKAAAERANQAMAPLREQHVKVTQSEAAAIKAEAHRAGVCMDALDKPAAGR